ncbi:hypothetical protein NKR23_g360 [Pleurostoma richardsiae]|uniref:Ribosome biogenesis protein SLX9 n=1 Tax=Pleurostoma richardsiae TaxID=41990 RepID=A0AA38S6Q7_9PEZI|nr:hypothetical protein NKR23_g360 [Pleurostoma richardsiae]
MAPTAPSKRKTLRQKVRERLENPLAPRKAHRPDSAVTDAFLDTKRDRRLIKHSAFVSKIARSHPSSSATAKKRRRPSKKLVATMESLAKALPELTEEELQRAAGAAGRNGGGDGVAEVTRDGKVRHRSLRSRPGALKRKERVVKGEMERFGVSLAQLASVKEAPRARGGMDVERQSQPQPRTQQGSQEGDATSVAPAPQAATANKWAALRGFISATMEQNPAFSAKG